MPSKYKRDGYKWFNFSQNNSGGSFVQDANLSEEVFIQAQNVKEVLDRAHELFDVSNDNSCPCCGDRWSFYVNGADAHEVPTLYDIPITECAPSTFRHEATLHYADGTVEKYNFVEKKKIDALPLPG